jgi:uncharacterized protein (DUF779 family)
MDSEEDSSSFYFSSDSSEYDSDSNEKDFEADLAPSSPIYIIIPEDINKKRNRDFSLEDDKNSKKIKMLDFRKETMKNASSSDARDHPYKHDAGDLTVRRNMTVEEFRFEGINISSIRKRKTCICCLSKSLVCVRRAIEYDFKSLDWKRILWNVNKISYIYGLPIFIAQIEVEIFNTTKLIDDAVNGFYGIKKLLLEKISKEKNSDIMNEIIDQCNSMIGWLKNLPNKMFGYDEDFFSNK